VKRQKTLDLNVKVIIKLKQIKKRGTKEWKN